MPHPFALGFMIAALLAPAPARAASAPPVLAAEDWRLSAATTQAYSESRYQDYRDQTYQGSLETSVHYGLAPNFEACLELPLLGYGRAAVNGSSLSQQPGVFSALAAGCRVQLLDANAASSSTPDLILETSLSIPRGMSRFRQYVAYLDNIQQSLAAAGQEGLLLTVGGQTGVRLPLFDFSLGVHYQLPTHAAFESNGIQHSVDFGSVLTAESGLSFPVAPAIRCGLEAAVVANSASCWRRNGQNVLDSGEESPEIVSRRTYALAGVFLANATQAYAGPAATFALQPGLELGLSCRAGLTPESDKFQFRLELNQWLGGRNAERRRWNPLNGTVRRPADADVPSRLEQADAALRNDDLAAAVTAWNDMLRRDPQNPKALAGLRRYRTSIQARAQQWYLEGMQAYVQNDYRNAIACWQECLRYQPANTKALNAIEQTRKKLARIRQVKARACDSDEIPAKTGEPQTKLSTAAEF